LTNEKDIVQIQLRNGRLLFKELEKLKGLKNFRDEWVDAEGRLWIVKISKPKMTKIVFRDVV